MKYKVELTDGCVATGITVNGLDYSGEDPRYCLSDDQRKEFEEAALAEVCRAFRTGELSVWNLFDNIQLDRVETSSAACDTCGDYVTTRYYEF